MLQQIEFHMVFFVLFIQLILYMKNPHKTQLCLSSCIKLIDEAGLPETDPNY